jgi:hypothetical protein
MYDRIEVKELARFRGQVGPVFTIFLGSSDMRHWQRLKDEHTPRGRNVAGTSKVKGTNVQVTNLAYGSDTATACHSKGMERGSRGARRKHDMLRQGNDLQLVFHEME